MSLRKKILTSLFSVLLVLGGLSILFYKTVIGPSFLEIELNESIADISRVLHAVENEIDHMRILAIDWSAWDDTYEFIQSKSDEYIAENLPISSFTVNVINLIHFYDRNGNLVWGEAHDLETEELIEIKEFSGSSLPPDNALLQHDHESKEIDKSAITGLLMTGYGPLMVASVPIITSAMEGPGKGVLIMGRLLNENVRKKLAAQTKVNFSLSDVNFNFSNPSKDFSQDSSQKNVQLTDPDYRDQSFIVNTREKSQLVISTFLHDLEGNPLKRLIVEKERNIFTKSKEVERYAIVSIVLAIVIAMFILALLLQKIVTGPIERLTEHVLAVGHTDDLLPALEVKGKDEISLLANEFDNTTSKLYQAGQRLQQQSFQMGMVELSSGILHNVRNSLLQISASNESLSRTIAKIPIGEIAQAQRQFTTEENDEKKTDLINFLNVTVKSMLVFFSKARGMLEKNKPLFGEIEKILLSYEKWAYGDKVVEPVRLENAVKDAYLLLEKNQRDSVALKVELEVKDAGYCLSNRIILVQVLKNLLLNAIESISRFKQNDGQIHINAFIQETESKKDVHLTISDNGEGMDLDVLNYIFNRGFSTKHCDNSGIGLHWCANAVAAMDGKIYAESAGVGRGAAFHLVLPLYNIQRDG